MVVNVSKMGKNKPLYVDSYNIPGYSKIFKANGKYPLATLSTVERQLI